MSTEHPDEGTSNPALDAYLDARVSERMRRIVDFAIEGRPSWDLCCDHGLIGLWAWHTLDLPAVHFVDRAPGVIAALEARVKEHLPLGRFVFHPRDAAEISLGDSPCNVFLTGVGYRASQKILSSLGSQCAHRVIMSVHAEEVRVPDAMLDRGWRFAGETHVEERGRRRTISAWDGAESRAVALT